MDNSTGGLPLGRASVCCSGKESDSMMKKWIPFWCLLLAALLLVSCATAGTDPAVTSGKKTDKTGTETAAPEDTGNVLWLVKDGKTDYRVVISANAPKYIRPLATDLITKIEEQTGVKLSLVTDGEAETEKEILLGDTNRQESLEALGTRNIYLRTKNQKVVIRAGSRDVASNALGAFLKAVTVEGKNMSIAKDFEQRELIPEGQKDEDNLQVVATVKIGSYNLHYGSDIEQNYKLIAQDILSERVDIVGMQEVYKTTNKSKGQDATFIIAQETGYRYEFYAPAHLEPGGGEYGNAIISKYPIVGAGYKVYDAVAEENRCVMWADINVNGTVIRHFNTHLSGDVAELQFAEIAELLPTDRPWSLTGDFNYSGWNYVSKTFPEGVTMVNTEKAPIPTTFDDTAIDNVIFSKYMRHTAYKTVDNGHSDHKFLVADVEILG